MERGEQPGTRVAPWRTAAEYQEAMELALPTEPTDEDRVVQEVASILDNSVNPWTHRFLAKLYTAPLVPSVVGDLLLGALNASVHVFSASPMLSLMEQTCVSGLCKLLQLGPDADGVSMPGGASSNTLAVQTALCQVAGGVYRTDGVLGLVRALEAQGRRGQGARPVLLAGASCHFSYVPMLTAASAMPRWPPAWAPTPWCLCRWTSMAACALMRWPPTWTRCAPTPSIRAAAR